MAPERPMTTHFNYSPFVQLMAYPSRARGFNAATSTGSLGSLTTVGDRQLYGANNSRGIVGRRLESLFSYLLFDDVAYRVDSFGDLTAKRH